MNTKDSWPLSTGLFWVHQLLYLRVQCRHSLFRIPVSQNPILPRQCNRHVTSVSCTNIKTVGRPSDACWLREYYATESCSRILSHTSINRTDIRHFKRCFAPLAYPFLEPSAVVFQEAEQCSVLIRRRHCYSVYDFLAGTNNAPVDGIAAAAKKIA